MVKKNTFILAVILCAAFIAGGCASVHEQLIRNNYLATGRAPEGWVPKKSLCPAFARNGWQDHPNNELCWAPAPLTVPSNNDLKVLGVVNSTVNGTPFVQCNLNGARIYASDPPPEIPQRPLLIYRCSRADGSSQNFYQF